jgi:nickel/cobalt transporter (NicO) family protein
VTGRGPRRRRLAGACVLGTLVAFVVPSIAFAHPLGNFTINHYADLRVASNGIYVDVVIDQAEIPTFTERQRIDTDGDGSVSDPEIEAERLVACGRLAGSLNLTIDGRTAALGAYEAGIAFPPGAAGLSTMRTTCEYFVPLTDWASGHSIGFNDSSNLERIGWRAIRAEGDGTTISGGSTTRVDGATKNGVDLSADDNSKRLTAYPTALLTQAPNVQSVTFQVALGGQGLPAFSAPDASSLPDVVQPPAPGTSAAAGSPTPGGSSGGAAGSIGSVGSVPSAASIAGSAAIPLGAIPGGVQDQISGLISVTDLSPIALIGSLLLAIGLGAIHAISPGHGKTVMAAYLVGSRGSARHALVLGMTVTVSHTLGVLGLAAITLFASTLIPPERLYPILGVASATTVIVIGVWLLSNRLRIFRSGRARMALALAHEHEHEHEHVDDPEYSPEYSPEHASAHEHDHGHADAHDHDYGHGAHIHAAVEPRHGADTHVHGQAETPANEPRPGEHSHGGRRHSHLPASGTDLTWRTLFTLGLAGGLVPSASALLLLLGSLAANRPAYGFVLVVAFGMGMAVVLSGVGLALVYAGRFVERMPQGQRFRGAWELLPVVTSVVVVGAGFYLMSQAVTLVF